LEEQLFTFHIGEFIEPCETLLLKETRESYQNWTKAFRRAYFERCMHWPTFLTFRNHFRTNIVEEKSYQGTYTG